MVIAVSRSSVRWSMAPVTGISRLAWKPRTAFDGGRIVDTGDVAEQPRDLLEPGLRVPHPVAGRARSEQHRARPEDGEHLVVGRLVGHRDQPPPGALVDPAGLGEATLALEAGNGRSGGGVVPAGDLLRQPGQLEEPVLQRPHLQAAVPPRHEVRRLRGRGGRGRCRRGLRRRRGCRVVARRARRAAGATAVRPGVDGEQPSLVGVPQRQPADDAQGGDGDGQQHERGDAQRFHGLPLPGRGSGGASASVVGEDARARHWVASARSRSGHGPRPRAPVVHAPSTLEPSRARP